MTRIKVIFATPGKLGIEFISLQAPYIVKKTAAPELDVLPGDKLISVLKTDQEYSVDGLTWTQLVGILRDRPVTAIFERPSDSGSQIPIASPDSSSIYTVTFSQPPQTPLGLEFERKHAPWVVDTVSGASEKSGVKDGDILISIDGETTDRMTWDELGSRLSSRPLVATFKKGISIPSVFSIFNPLKSKTSEVGNLPVSDAQTPPASPNRQLVLAGNDQQIACLTDQIAELQRDVAYHRGESERLRQLVEDRAEETRSSQEPCEIMLFEKQKEISILHQKLEEVMSKVSMISDAEARLASMDERISQLLREKKELVSQNKQLDGVVEQLLRKLQIALDEKPNYLDKRVVVAAVKEYINAEGNGKLALQRLADKLGLSDDERLSLQPKPTVSEAFISFLADNAD